MSNYTKTTDFEAKDSLPTGDAEKIIRGADFETEFDNIATAIATKADTAGPTFTGTVTIPTAAVTTLSLGGTTVTSTAAEINLLDGVTATTAELNLLDGVTATTAELNILDGVTATAAELNTLDGITSTTAELNTLDGFTGTYEDLNFAQTLRASGVTGDEFDILDGLTATAAELNILDGATVTTAELNLLDGVTATTAELNILDGVTSTAAELNILDGVTSTAAELNLVDGSTAGTVVNSKAVVYGASGEVNATTLQVGGVAITSTPAELNLLDGATVTTAEINILDGVTATTAELNLLDGVTATTAELNILDGVTATAAELNTLDGITSTTAELNILDGVTATAAELNTMDGITATTAELNILDGVTADATELNKLDGVTATTSELNYVDVTTLGVVEASKAVTADSNADVLFGDSDKLKFGAGSDLQIYHDGGTGDSIIAESGSGNLFVRGANTFLQNADGSNTYLKGVAGGAVDIRYGGAVKLATTSTGIDVTGTVVADGLESSGNLSFTAADGIDISGKESVVVRIDSDDNDSGRVFQVLSGPSASQEILIQAQEDAGVSLYHDNAQKFTTTSTGIDVTGTVTADGLTVSPSGTQQVLATLRANSGSGGGLVVQTDASDDGLIRGYDSSGNVQLQLDTDGGDNYIAQGNVGIGTSSPSQEFHLRQSSGDCNLLIDSANGASQIFFGDDESVNIGNIRYDHASNYMRFSTNSAERMRIDSVGRIGIGTSDPSSGTSTYYDDLVIKNDTSGTGAGITIQSNTTNGFGAIEFRKADGTQVGKMYASSADGQLAFETGGSERMRIDASGNVGINVTPESWLSSYKVLQIGDAGALVGSSDDSFVAVGANAYLDSVSSNYEYINSDFATQYYQVDGTHVWRNAASGTADATISWSEAMRIDSSGRLLIGKTVADSIGTDGIELDGANDRVLITRSDSEPLVLNRKTSDGDIAIFRKDGTTVGSILTRGSNLSIGSGDVSLEFNSSNDAVLPSSTSTNNTRDAAVDLGISSVRFKDLYLSGGAYLGGTSSANHLDDYEEGTWIGAVADAESGGNESSTGVSGTYVKIGKIVYIQFNVSNINTTGMTAGNDVYITGLPFTSASVTGNAKYTGTAHMSVVTFSETPILNLNESSTALRIAEVRSGAGVDFVLVSQLSSGASDIHGNITYQTA
jgi:hypothetical protein